MKDLKFSVKANLMITWLPSGDLTVPVNPSI